MPGIRLGTYNAREPRFVEAMMPSKAYLLGAAIVIGLSLKSGAQAPQAKPQLIADWRLMSADSID